MSKPLLKYVLIAGSYNLEATERLKAELRQSEPPPVLVETNNTTVLTSVGQTAYLYCGVHNLGERAVRTTTTQLPPVM